MFLFGLDCSKVQHLPCHSTAYVVLQGSLILPFRILFPFLCLLRIYYTYSYSFTIPSEENLFCVVSVWWSRDLSVSVCTFWTSELFQFDAGSQLEQCESAAVTANSWMEKEEAAKASPGRKIAAGMNLQQISENPPGSGGCFIACGSIKTFFTPLQQPQGFCWSRDMSGLNPSEQLGLWPKQEVGKLSFPFGHCSVPKQQLCHQLSDFTLFSPC